ncbi:MAG: hypothetical protein ACSHXF_04150 [Aquaticitalea sp.]
MDENTENLKRRLNQAIDKIERAKFEDEERLKKIELEIEKSKGELERTKIDFKEIEEKAIDFIFHNKVNYVVSLNQLLTYNKIDPVL